MRSSGCVGKEIVQGLLVRRRQGRDSLAALDADYADLLSLKAEAERGLADELRDTQERVTELRSAGSQHS